MVKKGFALIVSILIVIVLLHSCAAVQVAPLDVYRTMSGMAQAVRGQPGTFVFTNPNVELVVLGWPVGEKYAFAVLNRAGEAFDLAKFCNANKVCWQTAGEFTTWLEANGWQSVPAGTLAPSLVSVISQTAYMISMGLRSLPSFLLVPMGVIPTNPMQVINPEVGG
jgi:hypothetical protein